MASASFREVAPPRWLGGAVWSLWAQQPGPDETPYQHRMVPNGSVHLVCQLGEIAEIVGPQSAPLIREIPVGSTVVGARMRPGAGGLLSGWPVCEIRDVTVAAQAVTGRWGNELGERLSQAGSPGRAVAVLAECLATRVSLARPPDPVVAAAMERMLAEPLSPVGAAAEAGGLSARHLRRLFDVEVGLGPKALQRLLRFQVVLAQVQQGLGGGQAQPPVLADLAARAGYVDQSHLSHECARLTGVSLQRFVRETTGRCSHGHDHVAAFTPFRSALR
jgi:AraC-like DNA-binding protein